MADIWAYVAPRSSETSAMKLCQSIEKGCEPFRRFPQAGASRDAWRPGLRAAFVGSYVVYYVEDGGDLIIVRVLHGARDAEALAAQGGFEAR